VKAEATCTTFGAREGTWRRRRRWWCGDGEGGGDGGGAGDGEGGHDSYGEFWKRRRRPLDRAPRDAARHAFGDR